MLLALALAMAMARHNDGGGMFLASGGVYQQGYCCGAFFFTRALKLALLGVDLLKESATIFN